MPKAKQILRWHAELEQTEIEPHPAFTIYPDSAALLVIDLQERLGAAMPEKVFERTVENAVRLIEGAKRLGLPIVVSEQYPKGLGPTDGRVLEALPEGVRPFDKTDFACGHLPPVKETLAKEARRQVIVVGQETHVCVFQTVRWLTEHGYFCHVARDGCCSRTKENWKTGLELMDRLGATVSSTEVVLFDLVKSASHEHFRAISKLVK